DTFGRVFAGIKPEQFQACFVSWVQAVFQATKGQIIAVDGNSCLEFYRFSSSLMTCPLIGAIFGHLYYGDDQLITQFRI
ncbi:MAG: hypothetical protein JSV68_03215, partial [Anaerolineaceae bacterium]